MSLAVRRLCPMLLCFAVAACGQNNEVSNNSDTNNGETNNTNNSGTDAGAPGSDSGDEADTSEPAREFLGIKIVDVSDDDGECMPAEPTDPGSDIGGALLEDSIGFAFAWAQATASDVKTDNNLYPDTAHLDGSVIDFEGDNCPELVAGEITTLGCGGSVVLEFVDESGTVVPLETGDRLRIIEHGEQCNNRDSDLFEVLFCTGSVSDGTDASCTVNYGEELSGEVVVEVP